MTTTSGVIDAGLDPPSSEQLVAFRAAVARLVDRAGATDGATVIRRAGSDPDVSPVLAALPAADRVLERLEAEVAAFVPHPRSNVATPVDHARLLLLQQIDVLWWSWPLPFDDDADVLASPDLVPLGRLRARGALRFRYRVSTTSWPVRARRRALRHWAPDREPRTSGLSYDRARPAVVALLDDVAVRFATADPEWAGGLWVNCLVRSGTVQDRLRALGYSAARSSSHCVGYAADVEMDWLARHGHADALRAVLADLRDAGRINLIDEGQAWHVCLAPAWVRHYEARFTEELACAG